MRGTRLESARQRYCTLRLSSPKREIEQSGNWALDKGKNGYYTYVWLGRMTLANWRAGISYNRSKGLRGKP